MLPRAMSGTEVAPQREVLSPALAPSSPLLLLVLISLPKTTLLPGRWGIHHRAGSQGCADEQIPATRTIYYHLSCLLFIAPTERRWPDNPCTPCNASLPPLSPKTPKPPSTGPQGMVTPSRLVVSLQQPQAATHLALPSHRSREAWPSCDASAHGARWLPQPPAPAESAHSAGLGSTLPAGTREFVSPAASLPPPLSPYGLSYTRSHLRKKQLILPVPSIHVMLPDPSCF